MGSEKLVFFPSHRNLPSVGWNTPLIRFINVDFPAPFSPTNECTSPSLILKLTFDKAYMPENLFFIFIISNSDILLSFLLCLLIEYWFGSGAVLNLPTKIHLLFFDD